MFFKREMLSLKIKANIMDEAAVGRAIKRLAHEIVEKNNGTTDVVIIGILKRGSYIASRLAEKIYEIEGVRIPNGDMDISFYRDDLGRNAQPIVNHTDIPFDINEKNIILVDDVLYTGRTVRAAIDCLFRMGRAKTVQLAVMIDRGLRELPIKADFVGKNIPTSHSERVAVEMSECDGVDRVFIYENN